MCRTGGVRMIKLNFLMHSMLGAAISLSTASVLAEEQINVGSDKGIALEEIIVTARKTAENLQDVPISINAFSSEDILAKGIGDLQDIELYATNVTINNSFGQTTVAIRGLTDSEHFVTSDPLVGIYIDGVYVARPQGALVDLVDLERIEVLKGPQGTLFGKNTVGGAISIISKVPQGEGEGYINAVVGTDGRMNVQGYYDFALGESLSASVSAVNKNRDCLIDRVNDGACQGDEDLKAFRTYMRYQPSDELTVDFIVDASWNNSHTKPTGVSYVDPNGLFPFLFNLGSPSGEVYDDTIPGLGQPYVTGGDAPTDDYVRSRGVSGHIAWDINENLAFYSISSYRDLTSKAGIDFDGSELTVFQNRRIDTHSEQFSQEFRLEGLLFDDRLVWNAGLYYFSEDASSEQTIDRLVIIRGIRPFTDSEVDALAGFAHVSYNLTERLRISGGARYTSEEREFSGGGDFVGDPPNSFGFAPFISGKDGWKAWSPKITLDYRVMNGVLVYGTVSKGFRSGGFNGQSTGTTNPNLFSYDPEFVTNYELGVKSSFWDQRAILNATVYFMDYKDKQFAFQTVDDQNAGAVVAIRDNAAAAEVQGIEVDLKVALTEYLTLEAGFAYNDAEYTKIRPGTQNVSLESPFLYAPKRTGVFGIEYADPDFAGIGEFSIRAHASYKSRIYFQGDLAYLDDPIFERFNYQDDYTIVNVRLSFIPHAFDNLSLSLYGKNLTDKIIKENNAGIPILGFDIASTYGEPREVGLDIRYSF